LKSARKGLFYVKARFVVKTEIQRKAIKTDPKGILEAALYYLSSVKVDFGWTSSGKWYWAGSA